MKETLKKMLQEIITISFVLAVGFTLLRLLGGLPVHHDATKWEYGSFFALDGQVEAKFDEAGKNRWELVSCRRARDEDKWGYECLFKRPQD